MPQANVQENGPNPIDVHVGERIRIARQIVHVSQSHLADGCDVSFQQIQKYESGYNRVSASRLVQIAKFLNRPVAFFYEGLPTETSQTPDPLTSNIALNLVRMFYRLNVRRQGAIMNLLEEMSQETA